MRIEAYNQVQQLYSTSKVNKPQKTEKAAQTDGFQLSKAGKDLQTAKAAVTQAPDIRHELVDSIKERIQNGTYDVSVDDFANKLLEKFGALN